MKNKSPAILRRRLLGIASVGTAIALSVFNINLAKATTAAASYCLFVGGGNFCATPHNVYMGMTCKESAGQGECQSCWEHPEAACPTLWGDVAGARDFE